jgi:hypothetical protein
MHFSGLWLQGRPNEDGCLVAGYSPGPHHASRTRSAEIRRPGCAQKAVGRDARARRPFYRDQISEAPFTIIYSFDDDELRLYFIVHASSDLNALNPADVEW